MISEIPAEIYSTCSCNLDSAGYCLRFLHTVGWSMRLLTVQLERQKIRLRIGETNASLERDGVLEGERCGPAGAAADGSLLDNSRLITLYPLALLGADKPANWVVLCKAHNRDKSDRIPPR